jgi:hypothetical protein
VTTHRTTFLLALARFLFALSAGLSLGILVHTIYWAFQLKREKRSRIAEFPPQGSGFSRTFYPNPVAEWTHGMLALGIGTFMASMVAGFSVLDGFMSSSLISFIYGSLAVVVAIAVTAAYFTGKSVLTVRVDNNGISYARGRGDMLWLNAAWCDILLFTEKSRTHRGNTRYWIELEFNDNRKKLKIGQSVEGYPALRDLLMSTFTRSR